MIPQAAVLTNTKGLILPSLAQDNLACFCINKPLSRAGLFMVSTEKLSK